MYSYVQESQIKQEPIDYLEFGVYQGDSIRYWVSLSTNSDSRFFGFDSFEGLPQQWGSMEKGAFDLGGDIPQINDERLKFIKGWFSETIPPFAREFSVKNRLVLHLDADLYGSTMLALVHFGPSLPKGTLLFFDEFFAREHEFRALMDWQSMYGRDFRVIAETGDYAQICAELL
jgi:O-methyltransferase